MVAPPLLVPPKTSVAPASLKRPTLDGSQFSLERLHSSYVSGRLSMIFRLSASTAPQCSRMQRSRASRSVKKDRPCQPLFFKRRRPFRFCKTHCRRSETTRHRLPSSTVSDLEWCAGSISDVRAIVARSRSDHWLRTRLFGDSPSPRQSIVERDLPQPF